MKEAHLNEHCSRPLLVDDFTGDYIIITQYIGDDINIYQYKTIQNHITKNFGTRSKSRPKRSPAVFRFSEVGSTVTIYSRHLKVDHGNHGI